MRKAAPYADLLVIAAGWLLLFPQSVAATQTHPPAEGLYVHQMAHVFFAFSMGSLIYWLRNHKLVRDAGWRYVQYGAFFFMLWNLDAMTAHYLDGVGDHYEVINAGSWHAHVHLAHFNPALVLYYLVKFDHLLTIPGIVFLYLGLRQLVSQAQSARVEEGSP